VREFKSKVGVISADYQSPPYNKKSDNGISRLLLQTLFDAAGEPGWRIAYVDVVKVGLLSTPGRRTTTGYRCFAQKLAL
jgi:hypothetical protein